MSASLSRICESLDDVVADLEQNLSGTSFPISGSTPPTSSAATAATCPHARSSRRSAQAPSYRRLLGLDAIDTESYAGWLAFLLPAGARRLASAFEARDRGGLPRRRVAALHRAPHTRRRARRPGRAAVLAILHAVFDARPRARAVPSGLGEIAGICPRAAGLLEDAESGRPGLPGLPLCAPRRIRTNNVRERANRSWQPRGAGLPVQEISGCWPKWTGLGVKVARSKLCRVAALKLMGQAHFCRDNPIGRRRRK